MHFAKQLLLSCFISKTNVYHRVLNIIVLGDLEIYYANSVKTKLQIVVKDLEVQTQIIVVQFCMSNCSF